MSGAPRATEAVNNNDTIVAIDDPGHAAETNFKGRRSVRNGNKRVNVRSQNLNVDVARGRAPRLGCDWSCGGDYNSSC